MWEAHQGENQLHSRIAPVRCCNPHRTREKKRETAPWLERAMQYCHDSRERCLFFFAFAVPGLTEIATVSTQNANNDKHSEHRSSSAGDVCCVFQKSSAPLKLEERRRAATWQSGVEDVLSLSLSVEAVFAQAKVGSIFRAQHVREAFWD